MPVDQPPAGAAILNDDVVVVFRTRASNISGRLVRLGPTLDAIIAPHNMTDLAGQALSEALALAALCGSALPPAGNLNLQTNSDGAVSILVADYAASGRLRGYARYDAAKLAEVGQRLPSQFSGGILGDGRLAITLDTGPGEERYQGVCLPLKVRRSAQPSRPTSSNAKLCPPQYGWPLLGTLSGPDCRSTNRGGTGAPAD